MRVNDLHPTDVPMPGIQHRLTAADRLAQAPVYHASRERWRFGQHRIATPLKSLSIWAMRDHCGPCPMGIFQEY